MKTPHAIGNPNSMEKSKRIFLSLFLATLFGCSKDIGIDEMTETNIGPSGGSAQSAAGEAVVRIPATTFPTDTRVTIRTVRQVNTTQAIGPIFELSMQPNVEAFPTGVILEIENRDSDENVSIANFDVRPGAPLAHSTYDRASKKASVTLQHFSSYGLVVTTSSCPPDLPTASDTCTTPNETCSYGEECCCGTCGPQHACICGESGQWACYATDRCYGPCGPSCHARPNDGDSCAGMGVMSTSFVLCCYGDCQPAYMCTCDGNAWSCSYPGLCIEGWTEPPCDG